jgi:quinolinate synthase
MNSLQGLVDCLENGSGVVEVDEPVRSQALGCIQRMLDFVAANPTATSATVSRTASAESAVAAGLVPGIGAA